MNMQRRSESHQVFVVELRRSNAAAPHVNKTRYTRKTKHKGMLDSEV